MLLRFFSWLALRFRHGWRTAAALSGSLFGAAAIAVALYTSAGKTLPLGTVIAAAISILLVSLFVGVARAKIEHLPDAIAFCDPGDESYAFLNETLEVCTQFNRETALYFGRDCVADAVVSGWWRKCERGFVYIKNAQGVPCAAACLFALSKSFMEQFKRGNVGDTQIEPEDILSFEECKKSDTLYLSTIIVREPHTQAGHRRAVVMVWAVIQYIKRIYGTKRLRHIYAVPINPASKNLVVRLGFEVVSEAKHRVDRHDLYVLEITREKIDQALNRIGDHARYCSITV